MAQVAQFSSRFLGCRGHHHRSDAGRLWMPNAQEGLLARRLPVWQRLSEAVLLQRMAAPAASAHANRGTPDLGGLGGLGRKHIAGGWQAHPDLQTDPAWPRPPDERRRRLFWQELDWLVLRL